jgi:NitT/TauT family transport system ATP-binding protein
MITHDLMEAVRLSDTILLMEADPGRIVQRFPLDRALSERDDSWVYKTTAELIQKPEVRESFSLV